VLIPFYNEAGNIQPLIDEVHAALNGVDYEIVCVNIVPAIQPPPNSSSPRPPAPTASRFLPM
jgi:hypothetical protein